MAFKLLDFLKMVLGGFNIDGIEEKAVVWIEQKGAEYPDLEERADALAVWLRGVVAESKPELDPETMRGTLMGIASDLVAGHAGVSRNAWGGGA